MAEAKRQAFAEVKLKKVNRSFGSQLGNKIWNRSSFKFRKSHSVDDALDRDVEPVAEVPKKKEVLSQADTGSKTEKEGSKKEYDVKSQNDIEIKEKTAGLNERGHSDKKSQNEDKGELKENPKNDTDNDCQCDTVKTEQRNVGTNSKQQNQNRKYTKRDKLNTHVDTDKAMKVKGEKAKELKDKEADGGKNEKDVKEKASEINDTETGIIKNKGKKTKTAKWKGGPRTDSKERDEKAVDGRGKFGYKPAPKTKAVEENDTKATKDKREFKKPVSEKGVGRKEFKDNEKKKPPKLKALTKKDVKGDIGGKVLKEKEKEGKSGKETKVTLQAAQISDKKKKAESNKEKVTASVKGSASGRKDETEKQETIKGVESIVPSENTSTGSIQTKQKENTESNLKHLNNCVLNAEEKCIKSVEAKIEEQEPICDKENKSLTSDVVIKAGGQVKDDTASAGILKENKDIGGKKEIKSNIPVRNFSRESNKSSLVTFNDSLSSGSSLDRVSLSRPQSVLDLLRNTSCTSIEEEPFDEPEHDGIKLYISETDSEDESRHPELIIEIDKPDSNKKNTDEEKLIKPVDSQPGKWYIKTQDDLEEKDGTVEIVTIDFDDNGKVSEGVSVLTTAETSSDVGEIEYDSTDEDIKVEVTIELDKSSAEDEEVKTIMESCEELDKGYLRAASVGVVERPQSENEGRYKRSKGERNYEEIERKRSRSIDNAALSHFDFARYGISIGNRMPYGNT